MTTLNNKIVGKLVGKYFSTWVNILYSTQVVKLGAAPV